MNTQPQTQALSLGDATVVMTQLTWMRTWSNKLVWIACILALVPIALVSKTGNYQAGAGALWFLAVIFAPLFVAGSVGEDMENGSFVYIWSRPMPRGAFLLGKLLAFSILLSVIFGVSAVLTLLIWGKKGGAVNADATVALLLGVVLSIFAYCAGSALIASLFPKRATTISLVYFLLIDSALAEMPGNAKFLSLGHVGRDFLLSGDKTLPPIGTYVAVTIGLCAVLVGIALWRIRKVE